MRFLLKRKKISIGILLGLALLSINATKVYAFSLLGLGDILGSAISWIVYVLVAIIATIAGIAISIIAYFIQIFLQLNSHIADSPIVQSGFSIVLSIANLGFVFGIIIIAIATILRMQSYGMKQILWKLLVMAILVNFSLVIANGILQFSNQLTLYFVNEINPAQSGISGFKSFASNIAGMFSPQRVFIGQLFKGGKMSPEELNKLKGSGGQSFAGIFTNLFSLVFPVIFLIIVEITLGALAVMLLIRYVFVAILLIVMPFAWMCWVFPGLNGQWKKWWNNFIRWSFFAPIMVFFLYLAMAVGSVISKNPASSLEALHVSTDFEASASNGILKAVSNFIGDFTSSFMGTLLQMAILTGLVVGGLFAANSLSITFADKAYGTVKNMGGAIAGYVGRRAKQAGTYPFRKEKMRQRAIKLQQSRVFPFRYIGKSIESLATAGGEKAVAQAKERLKKFTLDQKIHGFKTFSAPERIAILEEAREAGRLSDIKNLEKYVGKSNEAEFKRYNADSLRKKIWNESGLALKELVERWRKAPDADKKSIEDEIVRHFREAPNAGQLAKTFFINDNKIARLAAENNLPIGIGNDINFIRDMQRAVALGVAKGFSADNAANFFKTLTRGDQIDQFKDRAHTWNFTSNDLSPQIRNWLQGSGAKNLGIDQTIFV